MISWDRTFDSRPIRYGAHAVWLVSCIIFLIGIRARFPADSYAVEAFVVACIVFAELFSIRSFRRAQTFRHLLVIALVAYWAVGFTLRRLDVIGDGAYGWVIASFVALVVFARTRPLGR
jgi:hypothetical protein